MKLTVMRCVSVVCILAFVIGYTFGFVRANNRVAEPTVQQTDQAGTDLKEGRRLLKRGHADQALIHLQNALKLYTSANNPRGMAATQKELGDLYLRQGQYSVALDYYQKSLEGFMVARAKPDLAKAAAGIADDQFNSSSTTQERYLARGKSVLIRVIRGYVVFRSVLAIAQFVFSSIGSW